MREETSLSHLTLVVSRESMALFTTILQSGIEVKTAGGQSIGSFLGRFPGFTADYLATRVQTIFLNGVAVDDLTAPLSGSHPVLALSAAMPGLAGAILRRNSFYQALRSDAKASPDANQGQSSTVTLKLFNKIAEERGPELLSEGVVIAASAVDQFLNLRPALATTISRIAVDGLVIPATSLATTLKTLSILRLTVQCSEPK